MIEIEKPRIECIKTPTDDSYGKYVIEPLERGYGTTLGNSLRRVLLSSLPGTAVTSIRISGIQHEFSTIPGVKEDVTEIVLNIKRIIARLHSDEPKTVYIEASGECEVTAGDIKADGEVEILNPELHIATLGPDASLSMELTLDHGRGYVPADKNKNPQQIIGTIPVDSIYTPVLKVNYAVENTRVGNQTDFDKLTLEVWTDRTISPRDAVSLGGATLEVLAPAQLNEDKDDNNSLVMMLHSDEGRILLAGDMEFPEEGVLLQSGADVTCDVLKVPNHADDDTCSETFVRAAAPDAAVICTDTREKSETPDPRVVASLQAVGAQVAVTQECTGGILVYLHQGTPSIEKIDLPQPATGVSIRQVIPGEDRIVLANDGETVSLEGWYLVSDRGNELYVFGSGAQLDANAELTLGTLSTDSTYDLLWDDEEVIHTSKNDVITLYDANGMEVSSMDNGC